MLRKIIATCLLTCALFLCASPVQAQSLEVRKEQWYEALNNYFRSANTVVVRGKIWAETKAELNEIHVLEQNLNSAKKYYEIGESHWNNGDMKAWHLAWGRAGEQMTKSYPYLYRIQAMIDRRSR